jgi:peptidoglycan/xylan/chitin deacetylase (PgdA/CDA1 family)
MRSRITVAAALAVLTVMVGVRWAMTRDLPATVPVVVAAASAPPPAGAVGGSNGLGRSAKGANPSPHALTPSPSVIPSPSANPSSSASPSPSVVKPRGTVGPFGSRRMTGGKSVALTFDDGPHAVWTPQVLDRLRAAGVKATFCVVGAQVRRNPDLVRRIVREGHTLCNHSWRHELDLGAQPVAVIKANLLATNREIRGVVPGAKIPYFRQPGGKWTAAVVEAARQLGMTSLDWDVDPRDWETTDAHQIGTRVIANARPGSIILLHDGGGDRHGTLAACPGMIQTLKARYGIARLR